MTDKNWQESLRQRMSEHKETPPEGLWEALEAAGAVGEAAGSAAGGRAAAGAGLLGWLFGSKWAPVWWSLAGVAAAVGAVLLLTPPSKSTDIIVSGPATVAQTDITDPEDDSSEATPVISSEPTPVISSDAEKSPSGTVATSSPIPVITSEPTSVISSEVEKSPSGTPASTGSSVISSEVEKSHSGTVTSEPAAEEPATSPVVPKASRPAPGRTVVPLGRGVKRSRPLLAATLMGGGMPAGADIHNTVEYGMRTSINKPGMVRQVSMLSRNRITETITSRKMDYQVGLMASLNITRHWGVETGIQYTRLGSSIVSNSGSISSTTEEKINYIGVPLHVVYTPVQLRLLSVYLSAGPEIEYGLSRSWRVQDMIDSVPTVKDGGIDHPGDFVFSGSLNAGVQVHPFRHGAFFLQPGVVFRHTGDTSVESYYTDHPVSFRLAAGYRLTF